MDMKSLEAAWDHFWRILAPGAPSPTYDYRFVKQEIVGPGPNLRQRIAQAGLRDWQIDRAWPKHRVGVELQGGAWMQTSTGRGRGHAHPVKLTNDYRKLNCAQAHGWTVFQFNSEMLEAEPTACVGQVLAALERNGLINIGGGTWVWQDDRGPGYDLGEEDDDGEA